MKANELMIGDWVQPCSRSYPVQVESLPVDTINGDMGAAFDPIPLTPEILEKNGFIIKHPESEKRTYWRDCAGQIVGHKNRGLMLMEIHGNPKKFGYFIPYFKGHLYYVHELQHALRLCGIDKEIEL